MATPGFGFSTGDFIAAIQLVTKVAKALKDTEVQPMVAASLFKNSNICNLFLNN